MAPPPTVWLLPQLCDSLPQLCGSSPYCVTPPPTVWLLPQLCGSSPYCVTPPPTVWLHPQLYGSSPYCVAPLTHFLFLDCSFIFRASVSVVLVHSRAMISFLSGNTLQTHKHHYTLPDSELSINSLHVYFISTVYYNHLLIARACIHRNI